MIIATFATKTERVTVTRSRTQNDVETRLEALFKSEHPKLCAFAEQLTGDQELSRDIVADAFEYAWSNAHELGDKELRSIIYTVVHDRCIDSLRKRKVEQRYLDFYCNMLRISEGETIDQRLAQIERALCTMHPKKQHLLRECYHLHRTYDYVAEDMHISKSTLKLRLSEALNELCKKVKMLNGW